MRPLIFAAALSACSLLSPVPLAAQDENEITLEVLDDISDIDGVIMSLEVDESISTDSDDTGQASQDDYDGREDSDELADSSAELDEFSEDSEDSGEFDLIEDEEPDSVDEDENMDDSDLEDLD